MASKTDEEIDAAIEKMINQNSPVEGIIKEIWCRQDNEVENRIQVVLVVRDGKKLSDMRRLQGHWNGVEFIYRQASTSEMLTQEAKDEMVGFEQWYPPSPK
jgi:predicted RND superfamily exporter protein